MLLIFILQVSCISSDVNVSLYKGDLTPQDSAPASQSLQILSQDKYTATSAEEITFNLSTENITLNASDISLETTGTANCGQVQITNPTTDSPSVKISNCTGQGRVKISTYSQKSLDVLINNSPGVTFGDEKSIVLNNSETKAYILTTTPTALIEVDLQTGVRTIISDSVTGTGTNFNFVGGGSLKINNAETEMIIADYNSSYLFSVDLATGNRTLLNGDVGTPDTIGLSYGATENDIYFSADNGIFPALFHIDATTENKTIIASDYVPVGTGDSMISIVSILYSPVTSKIYVSNGVSKEILEIDPATGNRFVMSEFGNRGTGPDFWFTGELNLLDNTHFTVVSSLTDTIYKVNYITGDREIIGQNSTGSGLDIEYSTYANSKINNGAYIMDQNDTRIYYLDFDTGNRIIISD